MSFWFEFRTLEVSTVKLHKLFYIYKLATQKYKFVKWINWQIIGIRMLGMEKFAIHYTKLMKNLDALEEKIKGLVKFILIYSQQS